MKLTRLQLEHYPTVKFLISSPLAVGKSTLLAYAYLMEAIEHQGRAYKPIDFPNDDFRSQKLMLQRIQELAKSLDVGIKIKMNDMTFTVIKSNPFLSDEMNQAINDSANYRKG